MRQLCIMLTAVTGPLLIASTAFAHPGHAEPTHGVWDGVTHPLLGFDHLLAMVTVGLLAAQRGGRAMWAVPSAFVLSNMADSPACSVERSSPAPGCFSHFCCKCDERLSRTVAKWKLLTSAGSAQM